MRRRTLLTTAAATLGVTAGCTGSGGDGDDGASESPPTTTTGDVTAAETRVVMKDTSFQPLEAEAEPGTAVAWVNSDGTEHTVTSAQFHDSAKSWRFDRRVPAGERVTHPFDQQGVYEYTCTVHGKGTMCGAVLVGDATLDESLPCADGGGGGGYY